MTMGATGPGKTIIVRLALSFILVAAAVVYAIWLDDLYVAILALPFFCLLYTSPSPRD